MANCSHQRKMRLFVVSVTKSLRLSNKVSSYSSSSPVFILCDKCYWCATYFDKTRGPINNNCPHCNAGIELSIFPIMSNESFTFDYNERRGVELQSGSR
ncbi:MAG TPA: hypothetical protein VH796_03490 [Nitrososphaeraceae archaeon]